MKTSQFIRNAKRHLWDGHGDQQPDEENFVCGCLFAEHVTGRDTEAAHDAACEHVYRLLNGHMALPVWIAEATGTPKEVILRDRAKVQATRLAWMDDMADWFEKQGD